MLGKGGHHPGSWRLGDENTERQAGERSRRHDQQVLVLDQVLHRAKQRLVERMRALEVERQNVHRLAVDVELIAVLVVQHLDTAVLGFSALP
jgi:hypothetical protein